MRITTMTQGQDRRAVRAARSAPIAGSPTSAPARRSGSTGHQEDGNALVRFSRLVDQVEGAGKGKAYVSGEVFCWIRSGGRRIDQSHVPVVRHYEAVGHAVRAAYTYTGMAPMRRSSMTWTMNRQPSPVGQHHE